MPHLDQRVQGTGQKAAALVAERIRQRLMVYSWRGHGIGQLHVVVDHVRDDVVRHGNDAGSARGADDHEQFTVRVEDDAGSHGREHTFTRRDRVGFTLHQAVAVGSAGCGREVVHLVIEQEARAGHGHVAAVTVVQGRGGAYRVAVGIDHRIVGGGASRPKRCIERWGRCGPARVDGTPQAVGVVLRQQHGPGNRDEVRVAQVHVAVGEGAAHRLGLQVNQFRRAKRRQGVVAFQDIHDEGQGDTAGGGRCHRVDRVAAILEDDGLAPQGAIARQIFMGDDPTAPLHLLHDQVGHPAAIEPVLAVVADGLQRPREIGLPPDRPLHRGLAIRQERLAGSRKQVEPVAVTVDRALTVFVHQEAVARHHDGGGDEFVEG